MLKLNLLNENSQGFSIRLDAVTHNQMRAVEVRPVDVTFDWLMDALRRTRGENYWVARLSSTKEICRGVVRRIGKSD